MGNIYNEHGCRSFRGIKLNFDYVLLIGTRETQASDRWGYFKKKKILLSCPLIYVYPEPQIETLYGIRDFAEVTS
jgi:hypothetical protein